MKILYKLLFTIIISSLLLYISCEKKQSSRINGKWKVDEVGVTGLSIFYEFKNDTIEIKCVFDKKFIDSTGGDLSGTILEKYTIKSDNPDTLTLEAVDLKTKLRGEYKIQAAEDNMILIDSHGEIYNLKKIRN